MTSTQHSRYSKCYSRSMQRQTVKVVSTLVLMLSLQPITTDVAKLLEQTRQRQLTVPVRGFRGIAVRGMSAPAVLRLGCSQKSIRVNGRCD